jgi:hypothetical protein
MGGAGSAHLPPAKLEAVFDRVIASEPALAGTCGARLSAPFVSVAGVSEGVQVARGRTTQKYNWLEDPLERLHGASRQDVQNAISDMLSDFAFDSATCPDSGSDFICVGIDPWSERGVCTPDGDSMPTIPEDRLLAWCARERIRSEEDCCMESVKILRLLASREAAAAVEFPRRRRKCSETSLLGHKREMLPQPGGAGISRKRIVPIGITTDDSALCEHRRGSSHSRKSTPRGPRVHRQGLRKRNL